MTRYAFGDIILVDFPFTNRSASKRRPALVLAHDLDDDVLIARITSKQRDSTSDVTVVDWPMSRLLFPSTVCLSKLATLSTSLVENKIGELSKSDQAEVLSALRMFVESLRS